MNRLVATILKEAAARGISQKFLAAAAGIPEETLSRMKRKTSVRSEALERLARGAGLRLTLVNELDADSPLKTPSVAGKHAQLKTAFQQKYRKLVWSNPEAPAEVFVRQALLKPDFSVLLDAATEFGLDFVDQQWTLLQAEASQEAVRAMPVTQRMLRNIRHGYEQAAA